MKITIYLCLTYVIFFSAYGNAVENQRSRVCYQITSRTVLPHLDEMRRIIKTVEVVIEDRDATSFFPVLRSPSFNGCRLMPTDSKDSFQLACETIGAASGYATLSETRASSLKGDLYVKMGGKNMTFSQHIAAIKYRGCQESGERPDGSPPKGLK